MNGDKNMDAIIGFIDWLSRLNFFGGSMNIFAVASFSIWIVYPLNILRKKVGWIKGVILSVIIAYAFWAILDEVYVYVLLIPQEWTLDVVIMRLVWKMSFVYFALRLCSKYEILAPQGELKLVSIKNALLITAYTVFMWYVDVPISKGMSYRSPEPLPYPRWEMFLIGQTCWIFMTVIYILLWDKHGLRRRPNPSTDKNDT
jgi:hypothetical protein